MRIGYADISTSKFTSTNLSLTPTEEIALNFLINNKEIIKIKKLECFISENMVMLAKGMAKSVIANLIHFCGIDSSNKDEKISVVLFTSGQIILNFMDTNDVHQRQYDILPGFDGEYQVRSILVHSKSYKKVQDMFIKNMDDLLGVTFHRISRSEFIRAVWTITILE